MEHISFNNLFRWNYDGEENIIDFPYCAAVNKSIKEAVNEEKYTIDNLEWCICPEDVVSEANKGSRLYKLVEMTDEEIEGIRKVTDFLVNLDDGI